MLQAVQKLIDEEFQGIAHLRTSTLHKKIATARHDFIKISGAENKLESLLQVDYKLVIVLGFFYTNECELCVCWSKWMADLCMPISSLNTWILVISLFKAKIGPIPLNRIRLTTFGLFFILWWQVLEPSLAKGNRVMVFCNTLNSSRAVDHFLSENQIFTVNYHGEVPAEKRWDHYISWLLNYVGVYNVILLGDYSNQNCLNSNSMIF